jgi:hypothetical protein
MPVQSLSMDSARSAGQRPTQQSLTFRNYDHQGITEVTVTVEKQSGETVHKETYTLTPQTTWSTSLSIASGTYRVSATVGSNTATAEACQITEHTDTDATIELGNGAVSVHSSR